MSHKNIFFLGFISKFFYPTLYTLRPAVFFSSTVRLFDDTLKKSQELVKAILRKQGFTGILNTTSSTFNKNDLQVLKVSFNSTLKYDIFPCEIEDQEFDINNLKEISDNQVKVFLTDLHEINKQLKNRVLIPSKGFGEAQLAAEMLTYEKEECPETGLNIAKPNRRQEILEVFARIY
ncbi:hypothetical protein C1645_819132 [Glomus cerebriforme]|uniref:Uncharacterized protein n=1 Tax=Glomus cerebriforme TaxID=658196 RepID=A0A397T613_9GLOM|nr:hypothetical protein C1645_819132 [Glomus cerebriforme]